MDDIKTFFKKMVQITFLSLGFILTILFSACDDVSVKNIYIEGLPENVIVGDSINLTAVIDPYDSTDKSIDWSTPTKNLISIDVIDERMVVVTANAVGTAMIVVTAKDGNIVKTAVFEIYPQNINLALGNLEREYNASPQRVEVINAPSGADVEYTYTLRGSNQATTQAPIEAGIYDVSARIVNSSFRGECTGVLTIKKQQIVVQANNKEKIYAERDPVLTRELIKGKMYAGASLSGSLKREVGENVGEYQIIEDEAFTISGEKKDNYELVFNSGILKINKATLNMVVANKSSQYGLDFVDLEYTVSGFKNNEDESVLSGALSLPQNIKDVGVYDIINNITAENYNIVANIGKYSIKKAPIIVTADNKSKIYGNATPAFTYTIENASNVLDQTKLFYDDELAGELFVTNDIVAGSKDIRSNLSNPNYQIDYRRGRLTIEKRPIEIEIANQTKVYGETDPEDFEYEIVSELQILNGDVLSGAFGREVGENIGTYNYTIGTMIIDNNYALSVVGGALTITKRTVQISCDDKTLEYGGDEEALTYTITQGSLVGIDDFVGDLAREIGAGAGTYNITQGTLSLTNNYDLQITNGIYTINPKDIEITIDNKSITYGEQNVALTYQITDGELVAGDEFTGSLSRVAGVNVGNYDITQGTLTLGNNYNLTVINGVYTIIAKNIQITIDSKSVVYGEQDATLTYTITQGALVDNDDFTGALTRETGNNVGIYNITQGTLSLGGNYNLSVVANQYEITKRQISIILENKEKVVNTLDPDFTWIYDAQSLEFVDNDVEILISREVGEIVGTYIISATASNDDNYDITFTNGIFTILAE